MGIKIGLVHVGQAIENRMREVKMTQRELAEKLKTQQPNVTRILKKGSIETEKLAEISVFLDFNFFKLFCPDEQNEEVAQKKGTYPSEFLDDYKKTIIENEQLRRTVAELEGELSKYKKEVAV